MKKYLILYFVIIMSSFSYSQTAYNGRRNLTPEQLKQDFFILKSSLELNHPDLYLYCPKEKIDSLFSAIEHKLSNEMTAIEFVRLLTPLHHWIGNNHTLIIPPSDYIQYLKTEAKRLPFSLYYDNDSFLILADGSDEYILKEGAIIESINGEKIKDIMDQIASNISIDGFNQTSSIARATKAFSRFYAYYYGTNEVFNITYFDLDKRRQTAEIAAITQNNIVANIDRRTTSIEEHKTAKIPYKFDVENGVGVLTIHTFLISSSRKYTAFLNRTFRRIAEENITSLVLDLRNNGGGYPESSDKLLSYLIKEEIHPTKLEYAITKLIHNDQYFVKDRFYKHFKKQHFEKKGDKYHIKRGTKTTIKPTNSTFRGELFVLMNTYSASTTGHLLGLIKSYTNAVFIGEESGGNPVTVVANDILTLVLPNSKVEVRVPLIKSEVNVNFKNTGRGLLPDRPLKQTYAGLKTQKDEVLEQSLEWIANKNE